MFNQTEFTPRQSPPDKEEVMEWASGVYDRTLPGILIAAKIIDDGDTSHVQSKIVVNNVSKDNIFHVLIRGLQLNKRDILHMLLFNKSYRK